ncbi:uncharacterized protein [Panulirus ornatus]|uniref:uncharacterized protein n=1 Tax=Panulirus ornatus TaxID=150431 RepID=UPI003A893887
MARIAPALVLLLVLFNMCEGRPDCKRSCSLILCGIDDCDDRCPACVEGPDQSQQGEVTGQDTGYAVIRKKRKLRRTKGTAKKMATIHTDKRYGNNIPPSVLAALRARRLQT